MRDEKEIIVVHGIHCAERCDARTDAPRLHVIDTEAAKAEAARGAE